MVRLKIFGFILCAGIYQCISPSDDGLNRGEEKMLTVVIDSSVHSKTQASDNILGHVVILHDVDVQHYFSFMDSVTSAIDTFKRWELNEYVLVHSNPWIIDSLKVSDYYIQKERGVFLYDQSKWVVLRKGDSLAIPDSLLTASIDQRLKSTTIDLNIPEYTLWLLQSSDTILKAKVRVGRNAIQYLALAGHDVDLRTPIGEGRIIRIERKPIVINPETGIRYKGTYRDDKQFTKMPIIPWLEPEINGIRYGALIHPTTNPVTLGFPYSHGCVGTSESDAWMIYYNAPLGTRVTFRYDLQVINSNRDTLKFPDIYNLGRNQ